MSGLLLRVVVTGSESTGKTTLAEELARYYDAELVREFVRGYAEERGGVIEFSDHGPIARGQIALEDAAIARGNAIVVQDTDLLSTVVYCEHYFGMCPPWIVEAAHQRAPDLYLLCEIDVPWVADGVRDRGHLRETMQQLFRDAVDESGVPVATIAGDRTTRLARATEAIDALRLATPR
jgi:NadR type nicotinamide-nucleotide adenylyltransferase